MLQLFIVIFREMLEISMILGIVFAATKDLKNRLVYIGSGVVLGILGTVALAFFANKIIDLFDGYGQEVVNAVILLTAAFTIIYTVIWMQHHKKRTREQVAMSLVSLTLVTAAALFREGSEMLLFGYSIITSSSEKISNLIFAGLAGFAAATTLGFLMYKGIVIFSGKYIFKTTSILLSLISAGLIAQASNLLVSSQVIEMSQEPLWNTAWLIPQNSFIGRILHVLTGYVDNPTILEMSVYSATLLTIYLLSGKSVAKQS